MLYFLQFKLVNHKISTEVILKRLKKSHEYIYKISHLGELLLSIVILLAIIFSGISLILELRQFSNFQLDISAFTKFLANGLSLAVGIEFVKMLCKYTPEALVEIVILAIARQMVVEHLQLDQMFIGVCAIAVLCIVRKYFLPPSPKSDKKTGAIGK